MNHLIKRQVLDIQLPPAQETFDWLARLRTWHDQIVLPALEAELVAYDTPDQVIILQRLEIDLGNLTEKELQRAPLLQEAIQQQLAAQLRNTLDSGHASYSLAEYRFGAWLRYLQLGYRPWHEDRWDAEQETVPWTYLQDHPAAVHQLRELMERSAVALRRLVLQHSTTTLLRLLALLERSSGEPRTPLMTEFIQQTDLSISTNQPIPSHALVQMWMVLFQQFTTDAMRLPLPELIDQLARQIWSAEAYTAVRNRVLGQAGYYPLLQKLWATNPPPPSGRTMDDEPSPPQTTNSEEDFDISVKEALYVPGAGLVLLHPFLVSYFERLGLLVAGDFRDLAARERAILLLHWLTVGEADSPEYHLTLPKLLCNAPTNYPLPRYWTPTADEQEQSESLLAAVIEHWNALGQVSSGSLREGFLQRPGKLSRRGDRWLLQVEQHTIDILLNQLPWSLNICKLPWMPEMLVVEWA